ncbi:class A beta-lactamase [Hyphomicrobiales bacterium BP6-180914]|uniref:Beta-lactamase n=2 Tax=Lichenifustis flavocetrariae TaxID=2949735 RepID=A0AA42CLG4_9HYPH|nr:class A beta-lactamase [Lichenifustis flavocetrariae]MCW6511599.1 class A beta-lactamase [Lichenifustis flavocetrariae]
MLTRRSFAIRTGLTIMAVGSESRLRLAAAPASAGFVQALAEIEAGSGGRLGVAFLDTTTGIQLGQRQDEPFPMCSTFKVLAAGAVLTQADTGVVQLSNRVRFTPDDVVANSPITKDRVGGEGMTLAELCAAAIDFSDNTAGNMLLRQIGGPVGLTRFARSLDDAVTRLDRVETALNESLPGDLRDTTTPGAMLANLYKLVLGPALSGGSRDQLVTWLKGNTTGGMRLRAGLPTTWVVGDKTGAGSRGSTNDIAVIWPVGQKPVLVTAYLTGTDASVEQRNATIASVGRAVANALRG